jgi:hypothetical protein
VAGLLTACIPGLGGRALELEVINQSAAPVTVEVLRGLSLRADSELREIVQPGGRTHFSVMPGRSGWALLVGGSLVANSARSDSLLDTLIVLVEENGGVRVSRR